MRLRWCAAPQLRASKQDCGSPVGMTGLGLASLAIATTRNTARYRSKPTAPHAKSYVKTAVEPSRVGERRSKPATVEWRRTRAGESRGMPRESRTAMETVRGSDWTVGPTGTGAGRCAEAWQHVISSKMLPAGMKERADGFNHRPLTPWPKRSRSVGGEKARVNRRCGTNRGRGDRDPGRPRRNHRGGNRSVRRGRRKRSCYGWNERERAD
jgi:hypothetical protein